MDYILWHPYILTTFQGHRVKERSMSTSPYVVFCHWMVGSDHSSAWVAFIVRQLPRRDRREIIDTSQTDSVGNYRLFAASPRTECLSAKSYPRTRMILIAHLQRTGIVIVSLPPYLQLATSEMWCWSGGRGILITSSSVLQYCVYYRTSSSYRSVDCIRLSSCLV